MKARVRANRQEQNVFFHLEQEDNSVVLQAFDQNDEWIADLASIDSNGLTRFIATAFGSGLPLDEHGRLALDEIDES